MTASLSTRQQPASATGHAGKVSALSVLARLLATALGGLQSGLRSLQHARMMSTLSRMSDAQLTRIGITRSDIPRYADSLMAKETDQKT